MIDRIAHLPLNALPLGDFTLRLIVRRGGGEVACEVPVKVVEQRSVTTRWICVSFD